jgi:citrate lyase beta subunit
MITLPHALPHAWLDSTARAGRPDMPDLHALSSSPSPSTGVVTCSADADLLALEAAIAAGAAGILVTGCRSGAQLERLSVLLSVAEAEADRPDGSTAIIAATDGILPSFATRPRLTDGIGRLAALVWDQAALAEALGATRTHSDDGEWTGAFAAARAAVLLAAHGAGVPAYDAATELVGEDFVRDCRRSRADGFFGRLARDEAQVAIIEQIYGRANRVTGGNHPTFGRTMAKTSEPPSQ